MDSSGKNVVIGIFAFAAVLAAIAYFGQPVVRLKPRTPVLVPKLAVLPFDNLDGTPELELLAANATVAVTERLSELPDYDVVSRAEALEHESLEGGAEAIAEALGADLILAGSVERVETNGGRLRFQAYLVMPGERPRIWADEFFYDEADADQAPDDLAGRIRDALTGSAVRRGDPRGSL